jgi:putative restriction endonuclease
MQTSSRKRWTRDELLVALNLYHKLRFGQLHQRQPVIIDLAERLGRTPSSVAMKLSNLASLDPVLKLRGIKGLEGAGQLDREVWDAYHANPTEMIPLSQARFDALFTESTEEVTEVVPGTGIRRVRRPPTGGTESSGTTKRRHGQAYFRDMVLNNYDNRCGVTGLPVRELLIASHILPWAHHEAERLQVSNGIALNRLHDAAFDQGLIAFDDNLRLLLSRQLRERLPQEAIQTAFADYADTPLHVPEDATPPAPDFLAEHRKRFGFR